MNFGISTVQNPDASAAGLIGDTNPLRYEYHEDHGDQFEVVGVVRSFLPSNSWILDVGCGTGAAAVAANVGLNNTIIGIEPDPVRAEAARKLGIEVYNGVLDDAFVDAHRPFDVIVFSDVLEHLVDPASALTVAKRALRPGGAIIASVPNVAHWIIRLRLLLGRWEYAEYGIMDATHLRWFTEVTLRELFAKCGLHVTHVRRTAGVTLPEYRKFARIPLRLRRSMIHSALKLFPGALAAQNVVRAVVADGAVCRSGRG